MAEFLQAAKPKPGDKTGITLRDQFAMAALHGLMANPSGPIQSSGMSGWGWCNCSPSDVTNLVYSIADAMLKEREK